MKNDEAKTQMGQSAPIVAAILAMLFGIAAMYLGKSSSGFTGKANQRYKKKALTNFTEDQFEQFSQKLKSLHEKNISISAAILNPAPVLNGTFSVNVRAFNLDPSSSAGLSSNEFLVISEGRNQKTGEIYTVEGKLRLVKNSYAQFAFAIIDPLPPTMDRLVFSTTVVEGRSYFGNIARHQISLPASGFVPVLSINGPEYTNPKQYFPTRFKKKAYFYNAISNIEDPFTGLPFGYGGNGVQTYNGVNYPVPSIQFDEGIVGNSKEFADAFNATSYLNHARAQGTFSLTQWANDHGHGAIVDWCIKYVPVAGQPPRTEIFECQTKGINPRTRYVNEFASFADNAAPTLPSIPLHVLTGEQVIDCGKLRCHIKGIVVGDQGIVSDNDVVIEGDIISYDQSSSSTGLAVVTLKNLVIPPMIPMYKEPTNFMIDSFGTYYSADSPYHFNPGAPYTKVYNPPDPFRSIFTGVTNFIAPTTDRHLDSMWVHAVRDWYRFGSTPYKLGAYYGPTAASATAHELHYNGEVNSPENLDLEGAFFVMGHLKVDGIYHVDDEFANPLPNVPGYMITDAFGNRWDGLKFATDFSSNNYYTRSGNPSDPNTWVIEDRRPGAPPAFCADVRIKYDSSNATHSEMDACPEGAELPRYTSHPIVWHGSAVFRKASITSRSITDGKYGIPFAAGLLTHSPGAPLPALPLAIQSDMVPAPNWDPRMGFKGTGYFGSSQNYESEPPKLIPSIGKSEVVTVWKNRFKGKSKNLELVTHP